MLLAYVIKFPETVQNDKRLHSLINEKYTTEVAHGI